MREDKRKGVAVNHLFEYEEGATPLHQQEFAELPEEKFLKSFDQRIAADSEKIEIERASCNSSIEEKDMTENLVKGFAREHAIEPHTSNDKKQ